MKGRVVEVDICEREVGFVLSVGPVSLWLRPAVALDVLDTLARAIAAEQTRRRRTRRGEAAGGAASKNFFLTSPAAAATKARRGPTCCEPPFRSSIPRSPFALAAVDCSGPGTGGTGATAAHGGPGSGGKVGPAGSAARDRQQRRDQRNGDGRRRQQRRVHLPPGVQQLVITDCGYPTRAATRSPARSSTRARYCAPSSRPDRGRTAWSSMFYNDEHALTLGVRSVVGEDAPAARPPPTTLCRRSPSSPSSVTSPQTGTNILTGDQSGLDASLRPMWPSLFVTDIRRRPTNRPATGSRAARRPAERRLRFVEVRGAHRRHDGHAPDGHDRARRRPGEEQLEPRGRLTRPRAA